MTSPHSDYTYMPENKNEIAETMNERSEREVSFGYVNQSGESISEAEVIC